MASTAAPEDVTKGLIISATHVLRHQIFRDKSGIFKLSDPLTAHDFLEKHSKHVTPDMVTAYKGILKMTFDETVDKPHEDVAEYHADRIKTYLKRPETFWQDVPDHETLRGVLQPIVANYMLDRVKPAPSNQM